MNRCNNFAGGDFTELNIEERKVIYAYGSSDYENTIQRLKHLTAIAVEPYTKRQIEELIKKIKRAIPEEQYYSFYMYINSQISGYFKAKQLVQSVEEEKYYA